MSKPVIAPPAAAADAPASPISLANVRPHQEVVLNDIESGCGLRHRLAEMGLRMGVRFTVLSRGKAGPYILAIGDTRLVLGHGMANRVTVSVVAAHDKS